MTSNSLSSMQAFNESCLKWLQKALQEENIIPKILFIQCQDTMKRKIIGHNQVVFKCVC